jgi:ATP-dependent DNA helicase DinG
MNFPFVHRRDSQTQVLKEISESLNSGYKHILLEAPTGFGKSPVAVAVAMTLGSSYICTSTKDLQTQYYRFSISQSCQRSKKLSLPSKGRFY